MYIHSVKYMLNNAIKIIRELIGSRIDRIQQINSFMANLYQVIISSWYFLQMTWSVQMHYFDIITLLDKQINMGEKCRKTIFKFVWQNSIPSKFCFQSWTWTLWVYFCIRRLFGKTDLGAHRPVSTVVILDRLLFFVTRNLGEILYE